MLDPIIKFESVAAGATKLVRLTADSRRLRTSVAVTEGSSGTLSFKAQVINGQLETPSGSSSIDLATRKHIVFNGIALEAIEVTNSGSSSVNLSITQI